jgi:hypothetical protein
MKCRLQFLLVGSALALAHAAVGIAGDNPPAGRYLAGSAPFQRPADAPVIKSRNVTPEMRAHALRGVVEPVPASLKFLNDQGAWYTPFDQAGMPGYYDLRQLHTNDAAAKSKHMSKP